MFAAVPAVAEDSDATGTDAIKIDTASKFTDEVKKDNFNIVLTANIELTEKCTISTTGTIDLASYKLTTKVKAAADTGLYITGDVTVKGTTGSIERVISYVYDEEKKEFTDEESKEACAVVVSGTSDKTGKFTLESGVISGTSKLGYGIYASEYSDVTVNGGTVIGNAAAISGNNTKKPVDITITGGVITSNGTVAVYFPAAGDLTVTGGTFNGTGGFDIREGTASIANATINMNVAGGSASTVGKGTDYPMPFNVGVGVYGYNGSSYENPDVTVQNITVTATGVTKVCDVYYGILGTTAGDFETMTSTDGVESVTKTSVTLTVKDTAGAELVTFKNPLSSAATAAMIDLVSDGAEVLTGSTLNCTVSSGNNSLAMSGMKAGSNNLEFSRGSIVISGSIDASTTVEINATGDVKIGQTTIQVPEGATVENSGLKITNTAGSDNAVTVVGKLTIPEGSKLEVTGDLVIDSKASLVVGGTVKAANTVNNGTISLVSTSADIPDTVTGTGSVDTSGIASEGTLSGSYNTTTTFTQNQIITATGDIILVSGTIFTFQGQFIIPEGVTVTIEDGAQLIIATSTGVLINNGTIIVESDVVEDEIKDKNGTTLNGYSGGLVMVGQMIENNGSIVLNYSDDAEVTTSNMVVNFRSGNVINKGTITVGEESRISLGGATLNNEGTFQMEGFITQNSSDIKNSGTIVINGKAFTDVVITSASAEAVVQVIELENADGDGDTIQFVVSDKDAFSTAKDYTTKYDDTESKVDILINDKSVLSGITIVLETEKAKESGIISKYMAASGNVTSSTTEENVETVPPISMKFIGDNIISKDLALGESVSIVIGDGDELKVTGTVTGVKGSEIKFEESKGTLTVDGKITLVEKISSPGVINAASYEIAAVGTASKQLVFTAFATAVADGAKKIDLLGENTVAENLEIPAEVTVTNKGILTIEEDAELSIVTGAMLKNNGAKIDVDGVLYLEDYKTVKLSGTVESDVIIEGETDKTYCNLAYALANAAEGSTIVLSEGDKIEIDKDLTIPTGRTLDTNGRDIEIMKDATLTVDGTLFINKDSVVSISTIYDTTIGEKAGKVVNNGVIKSADNQIPDLGIAGAFYSISEKTTTYYYAEPVANAAPKIATVDNSTMTLKGENLKIGDVSFAGTADAPAIVIVEDKLVAGSITIDNASIQFNGKEFTGTVTNGVGTLDIAGTPATDFVVASEQIDDVKTMTIKGAFGKLAAPNADDTKFVVSGTVSAKAGNVSDMTVDGELNVIESKTITDLVINGSVLVANSITLTSTDIEVFGTLNIADVDKETGKTAGKTVVDNLYVGISEKSVMGAAATVSGNVVVNVLAVVADGCTVPESVTDEEDSTQFFVEDQPYVTAYNFADVKIGEIKADIDNARFDFWTADGTKNANAYAIGTDGYEKVDAKIVYAVYNVVILNAEGVIDISIDGNLLTNMGAGYGTTLTAGTHKVEYTLDNGWTGTATLAVNGAVPEGMDCTIDGTNFTISGDFDEGIILQLTGIEKSGFVPDAPDSGDNGGMTITDYLLIILVVLIVVMAIIVAMRLMRS